MFSSSDRKTSHQRRAFTLVEMLIVIGIIALLTAVLLPVLARVRETGRRTACMSNMKQLGQAFHLYTQDWNRTYPYPGNFQAWADGGHWVSGDANVAIADLTTFEYVAGTKAKPENGALYGYVKNGSVYICPSNKDGEKKRLTYSMNCALGGLKDVRLRTPAEIVLLVDEDKANDGFFFAINTQGMSNANSTDTLTKQHNGAGTLLFCDGHAKSTPFESFPLDATARGFANKSRQTESPRFHDRAFGGTTGTSQAGCNAGSGFDRNLNACCISD